MLVFEFKMKKKNEKKNREARDSKMLKRNESNHS